jgi:uncharacterized delta-60 repeat protein
MYCHRSTAFQGTICALLAAAVTALAQDGSVDGSFQSPTFPVPVSLVALEASGTVLYSVLADGIHPTVGRLTSSGEAEQSIHIGDGPESITAPVDFNTIHIPGATNAGTIQVIQPLANGQILVGGAFSHFNKIPRRLLVRLNPDGSIDASFNQGPGLEGDWVTTIVVAPDGKILAGGKLSKAGGVARKTSVVRLNPDGSLDNSFADSAISFGASVASISLQQDGKLLITAAYANGSFQATLQVYRLGVNGGLDATFSQGAGTPAVPAGLRHGLMSNGQILLSGGSGQYNSATVNSALFRLNADGSLDAVYPGLKIDLVNVGGYIGRILPTPDGRMYVSGAFDKINGVGLLGLARLHADGTLDSSFVPATSVSPVPGTLALQPDGKLLVGGTVVGVTPKYNIVRLNGTGGTIPQTGPVLGTLALQKGGAFRLPLSGSAATVIVQASSNLANWSPLSTNIVADGAVTFSDPQLATAVARFYRLQLTR